MRLDLFLQTLFRRPSANASGELTARVKPYFSKRRLDKNTKLNDMRFVAIDVQVVEDKVKQASQARTIAAIGLQNGQIKIQESFLARFGSEADKVLTFNPAIQPARYIEADTFTDFAPFLLEFIDADVLVAHHALYEIGFLGSEIKKAFGKPLFNYFTDLVEVAHALDSAGQSSQFLMLNPHRMEEYELPRLCAKYRFVFSAEQSSFENALVKARLAARLFNELHTIGVKTLGDLLLLRRF